MYVCCGSASHASNSSKRPVLNPPTFQHITYSLRPPCLTHLIVCCFLLGAGVSSGLGSSPSVSHWPRYHAPPCLAARLHARLKDLLRIDENELPMFGLPCCFATAFVWLLRSALSVTPVDAMVTPTTLTPVVGSARHMITVIAKSL